MLAEYVQQDRYPGCLFIAACSFFPETDHPIHQLAEQQKLTSLELTRELLREMDADDADMVAQQMELIQEGCLSKLLVKRQLQTYRSPNGWRKTSCRWHSAAATGR